MPSEQRRPEVTLTASSLPSPAVREPPQQPRRSPRSRSALLLLLPVLALGLAVTTGRTPPAPPPPESLDAELRLLVDRLSVTQSGVLVLPVELANRGDALQVRRAQAYGSPVREDPVLQAPEEVGAGVSRRFVALLAPDCALLRGGALGLFEASVLVRVGEGSVSRDLVLDLAATDEVRARVAGLCR